MDEPHADPKVSFARQRRNLLAVSLALLAFQWTGATFDKFVLLGNVITLKAPLDVTRPLWVAWLYFALRAYQYYRTLPGDPVWAPIRDRTNVEMLVLAKSLATVELVRELGAGMAGKPEGTLAVEPPGIVGYEPSHWLVELHGTFTIRAATKKGAESKTQVLEPYTVHVPTRALPRARMRAAIWVALNTTAVTEYVLPALVAVLPGARLVAAVLRAAIAP